MLSTIATVVEPKKRIRLVLVLVSQQPPAISAI
jgi:hypothetical protein